MNEKPTPQYGYILCEPTDPERTHWLRDGEWVRDPVVGCDCKRCLSQQYQKPLTMPDGKRLGESEWELVAEDDRILPDDSCLGHYTKAWGPHHLWTKETVRQAKAITEDLVAVARRKSPAPKAETGWIYRSRCHADGPDDQQWLCYFDYGKFAAQTTKQIREAGATSCLVAWMPLPAPPEPEKTEAERMVEVFIHTQECKAFLSGIGTLKEMLLAFAKFAAGKAAR